MIQANLLKNIPKNKDKEIFETLLNKDIIKIERIISQGHITDKDTWYLQKEDEFVVLLSGSAVIKYEDQTSVNLVPGDYLYIPALTKHRVDHTDLKVPTVWLAIFFQNS